MSEQQPPISTYVAGAAVAVQLDQARPAIDALRHFASTSVRHAAAVLVELDRTPPEDWVATAAQGYITRQAITAFGEDALRREMRRYREQKPGT